MLDSHRVNPFSWTFKNYVRIIHAEADHPTGRSKLTPESQTHRRLVFRFISSIIRLNLAKLNYPPWFEAIEQPTISRHSAPGISKAQLLGRSPTCESKFFC
jgi:hypothetical protein